MILDSSSSPRQSATENSEKAQLLGTAHTLTEHSNVSFDFLYCIVATCATVKKAPGATQLILLLVYGYFKWDPNVESKGHQTSKNTTFEASGFAYNIFIF